MSPPSTPGDVPAVRSPGRQVRPSRRTLAAFTSVVLLATAFLYDYVVLSEQTAILPFWDLTRFDWLMLACLLVVGWLGVAPLAADRDRAHWYWRRFRRNRLALAAASYLVVFSVVAIVGPILVGKQIANLYLQFQPPVLLSVDQIAVGRCVGTLADGRCHGTLQYPLGTNVLGYGMLYLLVKGARVSFLVALVAGTIVAPIAAIVGVVSGYVGGRLDGVLMRYVDVQEAIPAFLVYIIAAFFLGRSLLLLLAVFGLLSWGGVARLVRSETLQRRSTGYVRAARAAGASPLYIARKHILPNVASTIVTATTQLIPGLLLAEVALGYLRLNDEIIRSWGWTLSFGLSGQHGSFPVTFSLGNFSTAFEHKWWVATLTVVAIAATIAAFAIVGDALRDVLDPRDV